MDPGTYLQEKGFKVRQAPGECLEWTGAVNNKGYGRLKSDGKDWYAHRYAWTVTFGPIPSGQQVNHHCDNRLCVNPAHLYLGTQKQNMQDASRRKRIRPPAKLHVKQVAKIRESWRKGATKDLAIEYGVDRRTIERIVRGDTWT